MTSHSFVARFTNFKRHISSGLRDLTQRHGGTEKRQHIDHPSSVSPRHRATPLSHFMPLFCLLLAFASSSGQETVKDSDTTPATADTVNGPPFVASLLTIKTDWSQLPKAKEIEVDLRQALRGEAVSEELLQALPGSGPTILFPMETISYYSAEHYAQFLAWLKALGIAIEREEFEPRTNEMRSRVSAGEGKPLEEIIYPVETAKLIKDLPFLGLSVNSPASAQPFITRTGQLSWHVQNHQSSGLIIQRTLQVRESSRGDTEPKIENVESCSFKQPTLKDGQVLVVPAFPSTGDGLFRQAASQKAIELLLVIEQREAGPAPAADARLVLPDRVERVKVETNRPRTAEGGRFGGGMGSVLSINPVNQQPPARMVIGGDIMISWSEEKDVAWGFSKSLGKWARQELSPAATGPRDVPVVGTNLAVWWVGSKYYGYSGEVGRWDVLKLPDGHSPPPIVDDDYARVHDGDDIYTFAASTGRWSSPEGKESAIETPAADKSDQIKIFTVRHARAADLQRIMSDLYGREGLTLAVDERTNSVIARGPEELLDIAYAILTKLDEELKPTDKPRTTTHETSVSVAEQSKQYEAKEQEAAKLAQQLREAKNLASAEKVRLEADLRRAVAQSFAARQKLQQAELAQLTSRIRGIEQTIAARQKIADQIIERRVEDLLNPNWQWDQSSPLAQSSAAKQPSAAAVSPSPSLTLSPSPRITVGPYVAPEIEEIWKALGIKVLQLTFEESKEKDKPRGAFLVTEIYLDLPNQQLRVGDVIISAQVRGGSRGSRIAELQVLRGEETFPLTVEFRPGTSPTTESSADDSQRTQITLPAAAEGQSVILRTADEFEQRLRDAEKAVDQIKGQLKLAKDPSKAKAFVDRELREPQRRLDFIREEYAAQIRLLELDLQDAQSAVEAADQDLALKRRLYEAAQSTMIPVREAQRTLAAARLRLEKAKTLLDLYRKADLKQATADPPAEKAKPD